MAIIRWNSIVNKSKENPGFSFIFRNAIVLSDEIVAMKFKERPIRVD